MGEWRSITDFSPGIRQVISLNHPPGTAQEADTWRCYSRDGGVLAPLPRRINNFFMWDEFPVEPDDLQTESVRLIGLHLRHPVQWPGVTDASVDQANHEILFGIEYQTNNRLYREMWKYARYFSNTRYISRVFRHNEAFTGYRGRPDHMEFVTGRSNHTQPLEGGPIVTAFCVNGLLHMFPDDDSATTIAQDSTRALPGSRDTIPQSSSVAGLLSPDDIVGHQGCLVVFPLLIVQAGQYAAYYSNEAFYWTEPNDWRTLESELNNNYLKMQVGWENPTGYQVKASLTADQLLLIKSSGGAVLLSGDINNPRATTLPYVRGSGFSMNKGVITPIGLMYPVDGGGIWLWAGGDSSKHITPFMEPDFWRPPPFTPDGNETEWGYSWTQCAAWNEWVLFPNNWLFDTDREAFWRLDDPLNVNAHRWTVDWRGVYAVGQPFGMRNRYEPFAYEYSLRYKAATYRWHSQPQPHTYDTHVAVNEIAIAARGPGTVVVKVYTDQEQAGQEVTFSGGERGEGGSGEGDSIVEGEGHIWTARASISTVRGSHLTFHVTSQSPNGDDWTLGAPELHRLAWYEDESTPIPNMH